MVPPELLPFVGVPLSSDMSPDRLADDLPDVGWTLMIFTAIAECVGTGDVNQRAACIVIVQLTNGTRMADVIIICHTRFKMARCFRYLNSSARSETNNRMSL